MAKYNIFNIRFIVIKSDKLLTIWCVLPRSQLFHCHILADFHVQRMCGMVFEGDSATLNSLCVVGRAVVWYSALA